MARHIAPPGLAEEWATIVAQMPSAVRQALSTELWNRDALWALSLSIITMQVEELAWLLDLPL